MGLHENFSNSAPLSANQTIQELKINGSYFDDLTQNGKIIFSGNRSFKVYVIDSNISQRAKIASYIFSIGFHVEIFSCIEEFLDYPAREGILFISDEIHENGVSAVMDSMYKAGAHFLVVAYRQNPSVDHVIAAMRARVTNFIPIELFETGLREILEAAEIESNLNQDRRLKLEEVRRRLSALTRRERQVLDMIADGLSNKEIGRELSISPRTVEIHRMKMMSKMAAKSSGEAIKMCCSVTNLQ